MQLYCDVWVCWRRLFGNFDREEYWALCEDDVCTIASTYLNLRKLQLSLPEISINDLNPGITNDHPKILFHLQPIPSLSTLHINTWPISHPTDNNPGPRSVQLYHHKLNTFATHFFHPLASPSLQDLRIGDPKDGNVDVVFTQDGRILP